MSAIVVDGIEYGKPNMGALEGEWGRKIFETIANTPRADLTELDRRCEEVEKRMLAAKKAGTF